MGRHGAQSRNRIHGWRRGSLPGTFADESVYKRNDTRKPSLLMKSINRILLAVSLFSAPALFAAGGGQNDGAYQQAVEAYISGATQQLRAIRTGVDGSVAKAGEAGKQTYADVYRALDQCDAMIAQLRVAVPRDFDPIKARFEDTRARMITTLENVRKTQPVAQTSATKTSKRN